MARSNLIRTHLYPYHITIRTINKEWFDIPLKEVWRISLFCLKQAYEKYPVELISFVLMANHYHMLVRTPDGNVDKFMYEFNKHLAKMILQRSKRINRVFGGRYKWCLIRSQTYLYNCYRYVYQNPLRAGVVKRCENYPYSTLYYLTRNQPFVVPIIDTFGFKDSYALSWLNERIKENELSAIRHSLSKSKLESLVIRSSRQKVKSFCQSTDAL